MNNTWKLGKKRGGQFQKVLDTILWLLIVLPNTGVPNPWAANRYWSEAC